jgi:hypothetical protein
MEDIKREIHELNSLKKEARTILELHLEKLIIEKEREFVAMSINCDCKQVHFVNCEKCDSYIPLPIVLKTPKLICGIEYCEELCDCSICLRRHIMTEHFGYVCTYCMEIKCCLLCLCKHLKYLHGVECSILIEKLKRKEKRMCDRNKRDKLGVNKKNKRKRKKERNAKKRKRKKEKKKKNVKKRKRKGKKEKLKN